MTTVQQYQDVQTEVQAVRGSLELLSSKVNVAFGEITFQSELLTIRDTLDGIYESAEGSIDTLQGEQVINDFLASLKLLMQEYSALIEVVDGADNGYGENYGEGSQLASIKISVSKDDSSASKVFDGNSLSADDI